MGGYKDLAEAAGRFLISWWCPKKPRKYEIPDEAYYQIGRWAGHWGNKELDRINKLVA